jgi:hypothetical protein
MSETELGEFCDNDAETSVSMSVRVNTCVPLKTCPVPRSYLAYFANLGGLSLCILVPLCSFLLGLVSYFPFYSTLPDGMSRLSDGCQIFVL